MLAPVSLQRILQDPMGARASATAAAGLWTSVESTVQDN
jgi:hypothetical protein